MQMRSGVLSLNYKSLTLKRASRPHVMMSNTSVQELQVVPTITVRESTPKNFCDKDFTKLSGELSGAICLQPLF